MPILGGFVLKSFLGSMFSAIKDFILICLRYWKETMIAALMVIMYINHGTISDLEVELVKRNNDLNLCQAVVYEKEQEAIDLKLSVQKQNKVIEDLQTRTKTQEDKLDIAKNKINKIDAALVDALNSVSNDNIEGCENNMAWMVDEAMKERKQ